MRAGVAQAAAGNTTGLLDCSVDVTILPIMRLNNLPGTSITVEARVLFHYLEISVSDHGSSSVEDNLVTVLEAFGVGTH